MFSVKVNLFFGYIKDAEKVKKGIDTRGEV